MSMQIFLFNQFPLGCPCVFIRGQLVGWPFPGDSTQLNLTIDYAKNVHRDDPMTSYEAAEDVHEFAGKHHQIIFHTLLKHGPLSSESISILCELDRHQVARRLPEMELKGTVERTGKTSMGKRKHGVVWRARG